MALKSVRQVLKSMEPEQEVILDVYAYGINCACSLREGFRTVKDCLEHVRRDILLAKVVEIKEQTWHDRFTDTDITSKVLVVEMAK